MDIAGAKALKERLGLKGADEAPPASTADVPEDAPPVYHWLGVPQAAKTSGRKVEDTPAAQSTSLCRRLGLSFR